MLKFWNFITAWFASRGGFAHWTAGVYLTLIALYAGVPAFATLLNYAWALLPALAHEIILAALGVIAWYTRTSSPAGAKANVAADKLAK